MVCVVEMKGAQMFEKVFFIGNLIFYDILARCSLFIYGKESEAKEFPDDNL